MSGSTGLLYRYQRRWFDDRSRFKIGMFARQTGKTFTTTLEIIDRCFEAASKGERQRWVILSRGERQAKEAMDEGIKLHAKAYGMAFEEFEFEWKSENDFNYKALEVTLPHGSRITALPANPDTARGFSANVFLDEFAFHKDSKAIWGALYPVISNGWDLRITSTPNGKGNKFYELMTAKDDVWSRHTVDIRAAIADGLPRDLAQLKAGMSDDDLWQQEFELNWMDEASAWLSYDLISSCEDEKAGDPSGYKGGPCFVGVDIGIRRDLFVIWVWEQIGDVLWCREIIELKRASFFTQDETLADVMRRYKVARVCMDQTGMGEKPVEDAKRRHGKNRVEGVLFTGPNKLILATEGKDTFEDRTVRIPEGNTALRSDLHKLRRITSETGAPRFVAERDDDHADRTWAAFLGIHAAGGKSESFGYESARAGYADDDEWDDDDFGSGDSSLGGSRRDNMGM